LPIPQAAPVMTATRPAWMTGCSSFATDMASGRYEAVPLNAGLKGDARSDMGIVYVVRPSIMASQSAGGTGMGQIKKIGGQSWLGCKSEMRLRV
jgi:hypothetical protein